VESFCDDIAGRLRGRRGSAWLDAFVSRGRVVDEAIETFLSCQKRLNEPYVARCISRLAPERSVLFLGNSMPIRDMDAYGSPEGAAVRVAVNRGASGIDGNVATAAGYARALGVPVTALLGDLALLHDLNSLALVSRIAAPVALVVINNNGGGIFSFLPVAGVRDHFERYFAAPHGLSFEHAAAQFGLAYTAPRTPAGFARAYANALRRGRHALIEVQTERDENLRVHRALQDAIRKRIEEGGSR
jgi:2-succinyl-5-enolpyruvyl-6-hydroxy-3-cyclohexene-1-carboxylate synthase